MLALVLFRRDLSEFDQMISVYSKDSGKLDALAKGIKKITSKNSANLDVPCLVEIELAQGKDLLRLTKVQSLEMFKHIRADLAKNFMAGYVTQTIDRFTLPGEKDERIFTLLLEFFKYLDSETKVDPLNMINSFILKLWNLLGYAEDVTKFTQLSPSESFKKIKKFVEYHSGKPLADFAKSAKMLGII